MKKPDFLYVTYIHTTLEKVWQALIDPSVASQYWGNPSTGCMRVNVSDWKPGSPWEHQRLDEDKTADIVGKVVESKPPHRLVITWARPADINDEAKHSRVTFDIEPFGNGLVKLTVAHDGLEGDPQMLEGISGGWPVVLSNLKTLLETGKALPRSATAT